MNTPQKGDEIATMTTRVISDEPWSYDDAPHREYVTASDGRTHAIEDYEQRLVWVPKFRAEVK